MGDGSRKWATSPENMKGGSKGAPRMLTVVRKQSTVGGDASRRAIGFENVCVPEMVMDLWCSKMVMGCSKIVTRVSEGDQRWVVVDENE